jgi:iron complex outermembrane receptor protein
LGIVGDPCCGVIEPFDVDDDQVSWELSANYNLTDDSSTYARIADGFRAQSIQGRDVAFLLFPTVADSETILSFEVGYKADLLDNSMRINGAVFYYEIDDMQLSAVGGMANSNQLLNADKGEGYGFEVDLEWAATELLMLTGGFSYNHTEIQDSGLTTAGCGSGLCTPTDPVAANGLLLIDGNSFQSAPETLFNFTARYTIALDHGELYLYTDWTYQGETQMALYEAVEFETDSQFEGGVRMAYINDAQGWELGVFGRNITDEENVKGFIDFSNNTAIVNEPALWGVDFAINF